MGIILVLMLSDGVVNRVDKIFLMFHPSPRGGHFHTLGNPQPAANPARGNIYNPHYKIPTGIMPNQPLMNQFGGGFFNPRQGYGAY
jgi:hypothetical protein